MNREEAITEIAQLAVLDTSGATVGVLLPTVADVNLFQSELVNKLDQLPDWLDVHLIVNNSRHVETNRGLGIRLLHNVDHARGLTFAGFYVSSRLTEEQKSQYVFSLLPAMVNHQPIITFEHN